MVEFLKKGGHMKKLLVTIFLVLVFFLSILVVHLRQSSADSKDFNGVVPFTTVGGLMGFFNQIDGKIYLYDGNMQNCVYISQLKELGKPMKIIDAVSSSPK